MRHEVNTSATCTAVSTLPRAHTHTHANLYVGSCACVRVSFVVCSSAAWRVVPDTLAGILSVCKEQRERVCVLRVCVCVCASVCWVQQ